MKTMKTTIVMLVCLVMLGCGENKVSQDAARSALVEAVVELTNAERLAKAEDATPGHAVDYNRSLDKVAEMRAAAVRAGMEPAEISDAETFGEAEFHRRAEEEFEALIQKNSGGGMGD